MVSLLLYTIFKLHLYLRTKFHILFKGAKEQHKPILLFPATTDIKWIGVEGQTLLVQCIFGG